MNRNLIWGILCVLAVLLAAVCAARADVYIDQEKPEDWEERDLLRIYALYALDCDSFVIECGGQTMLVDGGNRPKAGDLVAFLEEHRMTHLSMILGTHPHDDHMEAHYNALKDGQITADVYLSPFREDYKAYDGLEFQRKTIKVLEEKGIPFRQVQNEDELMLGGARLKVYRYDGTTKKPGGGSMTLNDMSAVLWVRFGDSAILLTADIGGTIQQMLAKDYGTEGLKSDILKAPHHGKNAVNGDLLKAVNPKLTVITGKVSRVKDCQNQMEINDIAWKVTSWGNIVMETDGKDWYVNQEDKFGELKKWQKQQEKKKKQQQKKKK